jgi:phosphoribosylformylglycinamidine synthase
VARVAVDVMLKPEILDPQGQAILDAAHRLGYSDVASVRQGKHFEIDIPEVDETRALDAVGDLARTLLSNPVIEGFDVRVVRTEANTG